MKLGFQREGPLPFRLSGSNWKAVSVAGVGGGKESPSRKVKGKNKKKTARRDNLKTSVSIKEHLRYILGLMCVMEFFLYLFIISRSLSQFFCVGYPNLSSLVLFIIVFLFLQFSFSLPCQILLLATGNTQLPSAPIQSLAHKKKMSVLD
jgi:hypothetical protein